MLPSLVPNKKFVSHFNTDSKSWFKNENVIYERNLFIAIVSFQIFVQLEFKKAPAFCISPTRIGEASINPELP